MSRDLPDLDPGKRSRLWRLLARNRVIRVARAARHVRTPLRFAVAELVRRDGRPRTWRPRVGCPVVVRSGSPDLEIFEEIFRAQTYALPDEVAASLRALGRPVRVADLGANVGMFTAWVQGQLPVERIRLFEPDPENLPVLRASIAAAPAPDVLELHEAAAGTQAGVLRFQAGAFQMSREVSDDAPVSSRVVDVPVVDVLPLLQDADLAKIDIEGAEWPILRDERLGQSSIRALVIEYHHSPNAPPGELPDAAGALLEAQGFEVRHLFFNPPWVGQAWAWRERGGAAGPV